MLLGAVNGCKAFIRILFRSSFIVNKNGWIDNQGRVFIYYSIKNICEDLNCGTQKACKLLDELEKVGALERKRQGLGRPNKLYLKKMF